MWRVRSLLDLLAFVGDGLLFDRVVVRDADGLLLPLVAGLLPLLLLESALIFVSFSRLPLLFLTAGDLLRDFFLEEFGLSFKLAKERSHLASLFLLTVVTTEALLAQACRSAGTGPSRSDTGS